jgi:MFS family permease
MTETELPIMYMAGGVATLVTAQVIGHLADRYGKKRVFAIVALASIVPILWVTHFPRSSLAAFLPVSVVFMVFVTGRFGPAMALVSGSAEPRVRGSFMSLNAAIQQAGAGVAAFVAGSMVGKVATASSPGTATWAGSRPGSRSPRSRSRSASASSTRGTPAPPPERGATIRPMIVRSLLDTDLYKFTMMQVVLHHFPGAQVEYRFKCRSEGVDLVSCIRTIERGIADLCALRFTREELATCAAGAS